MKDKDQIKNISHQLNRREFLKGSVLGLGSVALGSLLNPFQCLASGLTQGMDVPRLPHFVHKAKRIIYLFQSGAPSQLELFDYKPKLKETLKIKATNTKNARSSGVSVLVDAFKYTTFGCSNCHTANVKVASRKQTEALTLQVHPNPANSEVTIDLLDFAQESSVQVKMSNMSGKLFVGQQVQIGERVKQVTLLVSHLPQGLFFVTVQGSKVARTAKLVITK